MTLSVALGPDTQAGTQTGTAASTDALTAPDIPWNLVIWNDPVNLMSYVSYVFQSYFGYSEPKANKLMMEVHKKGRSIVAHGSKEQVEQHAVAMHGFGLWATVEKATGGAATERRNRARAKANVAKAFKYGLKGITGYLEPAERELLRSLFDDVISMLEPEERASEDPLAALVGLDMDVQEPTDRALRRLLPNVMKNDDDASLEFRRLTERSLRETKIGALRAAALGLDKDELVLTAGRCPALVHGPQRRPAGAGRTAGHPGRRGRRACPPDAGLVPGRGRGKLPGPGLQLHHLAAGVPGPGHAAVPGTARLNGPARSSGRPGTRV